MRQLAPAARAADAERALALLELERGGHHRVLGYARIQDYAAHALDMSRGKARELVLLARKLAELPIVREAFKSGTLSWTKAREVAKVASEDDQDVWVEGATRLSNRGLEAAMAMRRGVRGERAARVGPHAGGGGGLRL